MSLVPTPIVDKNGVATHRNKKAEEEAPTARLAGVPAVPPATHAPTGDIWAEQRRQANELLDDLGDDIVIGSLGAFPNRYPTVTLNDMADGDRARGNCWGIVNEIISIAGTDYFGDDVDELSINTNRGLSHTAIFVQEGDLEYVVDYTARQFDSGFDFPLIATMDEWKLMIEEAYGQPFEYTPADQFYEDEDDDW